MGYRQIARSLDGRIRQGQLAPGDQLPTEMQLASQFAVNRFTVRRALAQLESDGKLSRQRGRGTFVAAPQKRGLSLLYVGERESHFNKDQFLALIAEAQARGHRVFGIDPRNPRNPGDPRNPPNTIPDELAQHVAEADWVIVSGSYFPLIKSALVAAGAKVALATRLRRVVMIGPTPVDPGVDDELALCSVLIDRFAATRLAVAHLHRLGHRRIALATVGYQLNDEVDPPRIVNEAYLGFLDAAHRFDLMRTIQVVRVHNNPGDKDIFAAMLRETPAPGMVRPTAMVCDADFRARPLYEAAADLALRIPDQLSVIGMGNTPWCEAMNPELSSISFSEKQVAHLVMSLCESGGPRNDHDGALTCHVAPRLVQRRSCAAVGPVDPGEVSGSKFQDPGRVRPRET